MQPFLDAVAAFSNKGFFEGDVTLILDRVTEASLKATPKIAGAAGGFIVENGLCAGYPYVVTHYLNTELDTANKLVRTSDLCIGIGYFEWLAVSSMVTFAWWLIPITLADRNYPRDPEHSHGQSPTCQSTSTVVSQQCNTSSISYTGIALYTVQAVGAHYSLNLA